MKGGFKESPRYGSTRVSALLGHLERSHHPGARKAARGTGRGGVGAYLRYCPTCTGDLLPIEGGTQPAGYTLDDHSHLALSGPMRPLFEMFREGGPGARLPASARRCLKLYVAYKAETNFVDVVAQKSRLRLSLNLHFHETPRPEGASPRM